MKISLALGFFDSVHLGHRELICRNVSYAKAHGLVPAVYTFENDLGEFFGSKQLYNFSSREFLLKSQGIEFVISDIFSDNLKNLDGKEFLDNLTSKYEIEAFFCGYDYTFGKNASCNAEFLLNYATHNNIKCEILPPFKVAGKRVSTTDIKNLLTMGEVESANCLLDSPYFIKGKVVHGRGEGTLFGYPTANVKYDGFLPKNGVYKTVVSVCGKEYIAVTNIGEKPTFHDRSITIETMLINFSGDLYGQEIELKFMHYIRPIQKFADGNELNKQIQKDIKEALC